MPRLCQIDRAIVTHLEVSRTSSPQPVTKVHVAYVNDANGVTYATSSSTALSPAAFLKLQELLVQIARDFEDNLFCPDDLATAPSGTGGDDNTSNRRPPTASPALRGIGESFDAQIGD